MRIAIIVGAGASKEFGLPIGRELTGQIAKLARIEQDRFGNVSSGDHDLIQSLKNLAGNDDDFSLGDLIAAGHRIAKNMPLAPSIDNFLDTHRDDANVVRFGKLVLAQAIQQAERDSKLYVDWNRGNVGMNFDKVKDSWIAALFRILVAQRTFEDFLTALGEITFISFNYDRCIHQYLFLAARSYFNLNDEDAQRVLSTLNIIYPYGTVGRFVGKPFQTNFGRVLSGELAVEASEKIRTFTEGSEAGERDAIRAALQEAETVMFLGFGFLSLNMRLLFAEMTFPEKRILATGCGLSETSRAEIFRELLRASPGERERYEAAQGRIRVENSTCADLFFEYERVLSG